MLNQFGALLKKRALTPLLFSGQYGIEREGQRIDHQGQLQQTVLPFKAGHPYLRNDFARSQAEMVTDYFSSRQQTLNQLAALNAVLLRQLKAGEMLWPLSMPPKLGDLKAIKVAAPTKSAQRYRENIGKKYGYRMQMMSAVHFNFSLPEKLLRTLFETDYHDQFADHYIAFHNAVYLKLAQNYLRYRYVLTYLLGASPLAESDFFQQQPGPSEMVRSLHMSQKYGYDNIAAQQVSLSSLTDYVTDLQRLLKTHELQGPRELYAAVRFHGQSLAQLPQTGVHYLELRTFDLNPFAPVGLTATDFSFLQLFLAYLLVLPSTPQTDLKAQLKHGAALNEAIALELPLNVSQAQTQLAQFMAGLKQFMLDYQAPQALQNAWQLMQKRVDDYRQTPSYQLCQMSQNQSLQSWGIKQARTFKKQVTTVCYQLPGYLSFPLTSQLILAAAFRRGINVQVLDSQSAILRLNQQVVLGNGQSSLNTQSATLLVQNRFATKTVLGQAGLPVPPGATYQEMTSAIQAFATLPQQPLVVKPKISAHGAGVTVLLSPNKTDFKMAAKSAFAYDSTIMVEPYLNGTIYRFLVIDEQVVAIAECTPANVVGDGRHTLATLVQLKNQKRGKQTPFSPLQLDQLTKFDLQQQGYNLQQVLPRGQQVYLRLAADFATGSDAIDVTKEMDTSYQKLALTAAKALKLKVAGINMVVANLYQPLVPEQSNMANILSVTAQPELAVHEVPFFGQAQPVTQQFLKVLFAANK